MTIKVDDDLRRGLHRDGFVVVRGAVPRDLVDAARSTIRAASRADDLSGNPTMTDLVNRSAVTPVLHELMGAFDPPTACQVAVNPVREPNERFEPIGYRDCDIPYRGSELHMDGALTIAPPQEPMEGTPEEIYDRYIRSGPRGDLGRSASVVGHNLTPLFQDPEMTLGLGSFTTFVFACLSDQTEEGCGQTAVLPGSHHAIEQWFRHQRAVDDRIGPEADGWPRLDHDAPNHCGIVYAPRAVFDAFCDVTSECTPDGRRWPRPMQVLMEPGDVCIATYHVLHSVTRNERGTESRKNIIFRLRNKRRQPDKVVTGGSDHPDRAWLGEFLDHEPGNDPWRRSKDAMCDMWSEWDGMREVVAEARSGR
jgi:hypothetical protein